MEDLREKLVYLVYLDNLDSLELKENPDSLDSQVKLKIFDLSILMLRTRRRAWRMWT